MMDPLWTVRRRRLIEKFVLEAGRRLRLSDWEIVIDFENPSPDTTFATITRVRDQKRAILRLNPANFLSESAYDQRQTLVHELLHCHLFDVHEAAEVAVSAVKGSSHRKSLTKVVHSRVEQVTDALADSFVALMGDVAVPASDAPLRALEGLIDEEAPAAAKSRKPRAKTTR